MWRENRLEKNFLLFFCQDPIFIRLLQEPQTYGANTTFAGLQEVALKHINYPVVISGLLFVSKVMKFLKKIEKKTQKVI